MRSTKLSVLSVRLFSDDPSLGGRLGGPRVANRCITLTLILGFVLLSGCSRWSCYELEFVPEQPDEKWYIRVAVTSPVNHCLHF